MHRIVIALLALLLPIVLAEASHTPTRLGPEPRLHAALAPLDVARLQLRSVTDVDATESLAAGDVYFAVEHREGTAVSHRFPRASLGRVSLDHRVRRARPRRLQWRAALAPALIPPGPA